MNRKQQYKQHIDNDGPDYHAFEGLTESDLKWWERVLEFLGKRTTDEIAIVGNLAAVTIIGVRLLPGASNTWQAVGAVALAALCPISTAVVLSFSRNRNAKAEKERRDDSS